MAEEGLTYSDDPLDQLGEDPLDRERLATQLVGVLRSISRQGSSSVVALVGPWGSGKTTLLHAIEASIGSSGEWYLGRYNPWAFSSYETAVDGFFSELRRALPDDVRGSDRRAALGRLAAAMAPLGALGGLVGVDATEGMHRFADWVSGDRSPEALHGRASKELSSLDKPVLMVLDDLDRLEPAELLLTFRLVRLVGRLPRVYYLLSYDQSTLEDVLRQTNLVGSGEGRARDYLEKMVQVRLDIPPLLDEERAALLDEGLEACLDRHAIELEEEASIRLQQAWTYCLVHYMTQPRAVKKLLTQVDALWAGVAGEVDFVDFVLVTFLRTFEVGVFDLVVKHRGELVGAFSARLRAREKESNPDRWARWVDQIKAVGARHPEGIAILLSEMFLTLRGARENMAYGDHHFADIARRAGIGSADFFDRYTQLGVPKSDLSDQALAAALAEMEAGRVGEGLAVLEEKVGRDANLVARRLRRYEKLHSLPAVPCLLWLGNHYENAGAQKSGVFSLSPDFSFLTLSMKLLDRLDPRETIQVANQLCQLGRSELLLVADAVHKALLAEEQSEPHRWVEAIRGVVRSAIVDFLKSAAATRPLSDEGRSTIRLCWSLRHIWGQEEARDFLWSLLDNTSEWEVQDFLALMVPVGTTSNGRSTWESLGDLSEGDVDALLGVDRVLGALDLTGIPTNEVAGFERRRRSVSFDSRRTYALTVLARMQASQAEPPAEDA